MKKAIPYILGFLLLAAVLALIITGNNKRKKEIDERVTLRRQDKIPYGTYVAFRELPHLFPKATIYTNRYEPGLWDSLSTYEQGQALIIIAGKLNADEDEMKKMIRFVENGNDIFISTRSISYAASEILQCSVNSHDTEDEEPVLPGDSLRLSLDKPPYQKEHVFTYPGKKLDGFFYEMNEKFTEVLGSDAEGRPNFIRLRAGDGNLYLHLAPLAFSNYFLLHRDNIAFYEKALSVIGKESRRVVWDEYYLRKKYRYEPEEEKKGWFSVLSRYPELKAALLTALFSLLLYVLMEMRRKQRIIPVLKKPTNDSLDFVKTIGRLYYDRGDHRNLARKMSTYFLEHVRNRYKLQTGSLDETFIRQLQYKTGAEEAEVRAVVAAIRHVEEMPETSEAQLAQLHKQLETFYQKTGA